MQAPGRKGSVPVYASGVSLASTTLEQWRNQPAPIFRFPICNYEDQDKSAQHEHVLFNALHNLKVSSSTGGDGGTAEGQSTGESLAQGDHFVDVDLESIDPPPTNEEPPSFKPDEVFTAPDLPPEDPAAPFSPEAAVSGAAQAIYDLMCLDADCHLIPGAPRACEPCLPRTEKAQVPALGTEGK